MSGCCTTHTGEGHSRCLSVMTMGAFIRCAQWYLTITLLLVWLFSPVLGEQWANGRYRCSDYNHKVLDIVPDDKRGDGAGEVFALDQNAQLIGADDAGNGRKEREAQNKDESGLDSWAQLQADDKHCRNDGKDKID